MILTAFSRLRAQTGLKRRPASPLLPRLMDAPLSRKHAAASATLPDPSPDVAAKCRCEHGRRRYFCKHCGGTLGVCERGRHRDRRKDCGGKSFCEHGRRRYSCKDCGGKDVCEHGRRRYSCKDCGGSGGKGAAAAQAKAARACEHGRERYYCKDCGGNGICVHGRRRPDCRECGGGALCVHGRQPSRCKECGGGGLCVYGRRPRDCRNCGGGAFCVHGRRRHVRRKCWECGVQETNAPHASTPRGRCSNAMDGEGWDVAAELFAEDVSLCTHVSRHTHGRYTMIWRQD